MSALNESLLSSLAWLAYLPTFPLPGIVVGCAAALVSILGSLRYGRDQRTDEVWLQWWVWTSLAVVVVLLYVILGFTFADGDVSQAGVRLVAWWMGPITVVLFSVNEAATSRRRVLRAGKQAPADIGPAGG